MSHKPTMKAWGKFFPFFLQHTNLFIKFRITVSIYYSFVVHITTLISKYIMEYCFFAAALRPFNLSSILPCMWRKHRSPMLEGKQLSRALSNACSPSVPYACSDVNCGSLTLSKMRKKYGNQEFFFPYGGIVDQ